jgi:hypothetical protein
VRTLVISLQAGQSWTAHTRTVLGDDTSYRRRLNTVNDVVAGARYQVTVAENLYILL